MWNKIILFPGLGVWVGRRKTNAADEAEGAAEFGEESTRYFIVFHSDIELGEKVCERVRETKDKMRSHFSHE
jgi:isoprenylcysteine carboxyl methyltransferase (ICMT) family protein YpbQ